GGPGGGAGNAPAEPGCEPMLGPHEANPGIGRERVHVRDHVRMHDRINLAEKLALLPEAYQPAIVGYMNDYKLVVVKTKGEFVWHKHDETDELFLVVAGRLVIHFRDRDVVLEPGELFVVPKGVEHCPKADEETHVLLIEPRDTVNTGDAGGEKTVEPIEIVLWSTDQRGWRTAATTSSRRLSWSSAHAGQPSR